MQHPKRASSSISLALRPLARAGLARRIYAAFLAAAVIPTAIAGLIGVSVSLNTLRSETLNHLQQEVSACGAGVQLFFEQVAAELRFLADMSSVDALFDALELSDSQRQEQLARSTERDFVRLAELHPHVYQIRLLDASGQERVRVDKPRQSARAIPAPRLQNKADRYYVRDALARPQGELYVSPLDLNEEFGKVELPERPVVRVATVIGGPDKRVRGLVVVNLHAQVLLDPLQRMVHEREGVAYLFDRSGHYLHRSAGEMSGSAMQPVAAVAGRWGAEAMSRLLGPEAGTVSAAGDIVAFAPLQFGSAFADADRSRWVMALALPERVLWRSVINLYVLYAVLLVALAATAVGGWALSRRLMGPLEDLRREAEVVAEGDFTRHVQVTGHDEIAQLGNSFNSMADRLSDLYRDLESHRGRLEVEVADRTRELAAERALLASVFRHAGDAILAVDEQGRVSLANTAAKDLFRICENQSLASVWPAWTELTRAVQAGETLRQDVAMGDRLLAVAVDATGNSAAARSFVVVARDVSEERSLQDERRQLDRQLFQIEKLATMGELAMGVAHEIGNPLAGMKAVVQALQYEEDLPAAVLEPLRRLESEVDRLIGFLRSFHGFAAPTALDLMPVALGEVLADVLFWTRKEARSQKVEVQLDVPADLPLLRADPPQLKQVLLNLMVNAMHAMPGGGRLCIAAHEQGQRVRIEVSDTGCGIAADVMPRIFDPFFTTRSGGSGLGLAITAKIVREHGATIAVHSESGTGARFVLEWPQA
jgi:signal transduction histidine kinase